MILLSIETGSIAYALNIDHFVPIMKMEPGFIPLRGIDRGLEDLNVICSRRLAWLLAATVGIRILFFLIGSHVKIKTPSIDFYRD